MASITKKYNPKGELIAYQIRVYRGSDGRGQRLKPYLLTWKPDFTMTEKQIQKELNKAAVEFETRCKGGKVSACGYTMAEFCGRYLQTMRQILSPTTFEFYERNIAQHIIPELGNIKLKDLTTQHIQAYVEKIAAQPKHTRGVLQSEGNISPSTVRRYLTVLQSILKQAVKQGLISDNPAKAERLTLPKQAVPKIEIFSKQEAAAMLQALEHEPLQFQALIQLAIFTGARRGELVGLKFSDFDYTNKKVTIERSAIKIKGENTKLKPPKDYETRTVSINQQCIELVEALKQEKEIQRKRIGSQWVGEEWVFTQWNGAIMNPQTPTVQFAKFLEKNGFKHRKFHALRHTSATLLLYSGINIKQVQSRLGHGDIETTNKYLHCIEEADEAASIALTSLLLTTDTAEKGAV